jgi:Fe-S-cluster containining protein
MSRWASEINRAVCGRCKGQCCYLPDVLVHLDKEKADRKLFKYKYHLGPARFLAERVPILNKRKDGSCVYYDREKRRCSIYRRRPLACKAFFCGRGTKNPLNWQRIREYEKRAKANGGG